MRFRREKHECADIRNDVPSFTNSLNSGKIGTANRWKGSLSMTCQEALQYIHSTPNFARRASLDRIRSLMDRLGNPQKRLSFIHIAGTNGKGSAAAAAASVLQAAGYRTGLFTSPYLERFHERIRLNGVPIPDEALASVTERVRRAAEAMPADGIESPNEFELVTAIALSWYAEMQADLVVLEVGLGGRYDATNVIDPPLACVITSISLDHTAVLGDTVEQIAGEKAGILKPGSVCVLAPQRSEGVRRVIRRAAAEAGTELIEADARALTEAVFTREGVSFSWKGERYAVPLPGRYQAENLAAVMTLLQVLRERGLHISQKAAAEGLCSVRWPGRMELLADGTVLLDCCHNPDGIAALCRELDALYPGVPLTAVMGMLADKDYRTGLRLIAERSVRFFAVPPPGPRALPAERIRAEAALYCTEVRACRGAEEALRRAQTAREADGLIVVCGSIPLVGEVRTLLTDVR